MLKDGLATDILIPVRIIDGKPGLGKERVSVQRQIQNKRKYKNREDSRQNAVEGDESEERTRQRFTLEGQYNLDLTV